MELIILAVVFLLTLVFIYLLLSKKDKDFYFMQTELIRELTRSLKSKDITEYVESETNDEPLIQVEENELIDLDQVPADKLLNSLKGE